MRKYCLKTSAWMIVVASLTPGSGTAEMPRSQASARSPTSESRTSRRPLLRSVGERLALGFYSVFDGWSGFDEVLCVSEINAENQIVARVAFDSDDIDAALEELDARYLAGEAAAYAHAWSVIAQAYAAFNRHELPARRTGLPSITGGPPRSSPAP